MDSYIGPVHARSGRGRRSTEPRSSGRSCCRRHRSAPSASASTGSVIGAGARITREFAAAARVTALGRARRTRVARVTVEEGSVPNRQKCVTTAHTPSGEPRPMAHSATAIERGSDTGRSDVVVSISVRTLLVAAGIVAVAGALASIGSALLMIFVSVLCVAVLSPVATAMERRLGWSRALCSTVLVLGIVVALAVVLLVLAQAVSDAVRGFSHDLPEIVDQREAQRCGRLHQRRQRLARHVEGARDRHHQGSGHGLGRRRRCRRVGLRGDHAVLLGHLPDAVRPDRRTARARLDRRSDVPRHAGALPGRHGPDHPHDLALHARQPRHLRDLRDRLRRDRGDPRSAVPARPGADRGVPRPHPHGRGDDRRASSSRSSRCRSASRRWSPSRS